MKKYAVIAKFVLLIILLWMTRSTSRPANGQDGTGVLQNREFEIISPDNVNQLTKVAVIGEGQRSRNVRVWSPDQQTIAVPGTIGIWLYDANNLEMPPRLVESSEGEIISVAFSPDGNWLFGSRDQGVVNVWDTHTEMTVPVYALQHPEEFRIDQFLFSQDNRYLITIDSRRARENGLMFTLWGDGQRFPYETAINSYTLAPMDNYLLLEDGVTLFYFRYDNRTRISAFGSLNLETGEQRETESQERHSNIVFSPDGSLMATIVSEPERGERVQLWDMGTLPPTQIGDPIGVYGERRDIQEVYFSEDSGQLITRSTGFFGTRIHVRDVSRVLEEGRESVTEISNTRIADNPNFRVSVPEPVNREPISQPWLNPSVDIADNTILSFTADGTRLLVMSVSHEHLYSLRIVDLQTGQWHTETFTDVLATHPDGRHIITTKGIWELSEAEAPPRQLSEIDFNSALKVVFSGDGNRFAVQFRDPDNPNEDYIQIWDFATRALVNTIRDSRGHRHIEYFALNPQGDILALQFRGRGANYARHDDDRIKLLDADTDRIIVTTEYEANSVLFSTDGRFIIGVGAEIYVWEIDTLLRQRNTRPRSLSWSGASIVVFSPDSQLLITNTLRQQMWVWQTEELHLNPSPQVQRFSTYGRYIKALAFSPDGKFIAVKPYQYGAIWVWGVPASE